jgi:glutathione S-transferase
MSETIKLRSTHNCPNTPRVVFALEELGLTYEIERVEDGVFTAGWGSPGPTLHDGDIVTIEPGAILRHLARREGKLWPTSLAEQAAADRWFEFQGRRLSRAFEAKDAPKIRALLGFVDAQLQKTTWLVGDQFTMVDVLFSLLGLPAAREKLPMIAALPAFSAYLDRVTARPAFQRTMRAAAG